ncbi:MULTISPECIES: NepR family anti-sigma factor [unclassified Beijerinckia]|uniref:NepR family anti-sigma factor n=1 Tax=unclassified Beijerinckia TaxID=2638183 RepID=UPI001479A954|nr:MULTISPECIES: NepR family anti-sigma factor [unclassified Beijerinckia]MDH7797760.1 hypothetical protein [Beijerinckia sp. GAS462]
MSEPEKTDQRDKVDNKLIENKPDAGRPPRRRTSPAKREVHAQIGRQLRSIYDDVLNQPIPDRFLDLLLKLEDDKRDK